MEPIQDQFHELPADRIRQAGVTGEPECSIVPHERTVLPVRQKDPAPVRGHSQDLVLFRKPEGIRLLGIPLPGGIPPAADFHLPLIVHLPVRKFNPQGGTIHPDFLAGDVLPPRRLDAHHGKTRIPGHDRILLIDTVPDETDCKRRGKVHNRTGGIQNLLSRTDDVRIRRQDDLYRGKIRHVRERRGKRGSRSVQHGIGTAHLHTRHRYRPLLQVRIRAGRRDIPLLVTGEQAQRSREKQEYRETFHRDDKGSQKAG